MTVLHILEWPEVGRLTVMTILVLLGWLISSRSTFLLFKRQLDENRQYIKELKEALKVLDDG